ncbi:hypothetical protein CCP3SC1AL1_2210012 [Gammaproteobacteria bacterium]
MSFKAKIKRNPFKKGDLVYYKDEPKKEAFMVAGVYSKDSISLGLRKYPDTEQDWTTDIKDIAKFKGKELTRAKKEIKEKLK